MIQYVLVLFGILVISGISSADAATIKQTMDGAMDLAVEYPDSVIAGRDFAVSIFDILCGITKSGYCGKKPDHARTAPVQGWLIWWDIRV
ncbi:MAG: hypothetical protein EB154_00965 [Nitrosopumilaceae archaeon]|nr:hypothetical protein [Nitrosopumilaceae archaeon]